MKEYTILAIISIFLTLLVDKKSGIGIFKRVEYYLFLLVIIFFKLLVNGYLTSQFIIIYNPQFFLNVRVGSIPCEDFLFGFSMSTMTIIFWERFKIKQSIPKK